MKSIKYPKFLKLLTSKEAYVEGFIHGRNQSVEEIEAKIWRELEEPAPEFKFID